MRICLVSQEYPPETAKGGLGSQTHDKAHGLAALGHEVCVVSRTQHPARLWQKDGAVTVIRLPGLAARLPVYTDAADWITYSAEVAVELAQLQPHFSFDLIDCPEWGAEGYVHLLNRTEWNHVPTVVQLHGPLVMLAHAVGWPSTDSEFYHLGTMMEQTCLRLADAVFSSGCSSIEWCARHYGLVADDVPVLHAGVDTQLFAPRAAPKAKRPTIVFVGRIAHNKGVKTLVEAACRVARKIPTVRLRLIGRGSASLRKELDQCSQEAGLPDLLDWAGFVERQALPVQLGEAHVFAAPSVYEGGPGFVYLEAMACGLPVVACEGSGAAEIITPGENGCLVPVHDVEHLAEVLQRLLLDPEGARSMGQRGRDFVKATADSRTCVKRLAEFYESVVDRCARGRPKSARDRRRAKPAANLLVKPV